MTATAEKMEFQTEVKQVLDLMIHSMYSHKEIFLRELISNASDALDKARYESLTKTELLKGDDSFKIDVEIDKENKTLRIRDNGIGMNRQDLIDNIGTIARSGTKKFMEKMKESKDVALIGQFGVGFYSIFMVASKVEVITQKMGETEGWKWTSTGDGEFEIENIPKESRGSEICLHLKDEEVEYLESYQVQSVIKKYSEFVTHPITLKWSEEKTEGEGEEATTTIEDKSEILNEKPAIWRRSKKDLSDEQYNEFYTHISNDSEAPLCHTHNRVEGVQEYSTLLYIPAKAPYGIFNQQDAGNGLKLYVKRVFIMDDCKDLLPTWLRFVRGIVDSEDLPLNVSREILQNNKLVNQIKTHITKKVLTELKKTAENDAESYNAFWKELGNVLKEGFYMNWEHLDELKKLLRFESSQTGALTSLTDYVARMQADQKEIYFITGESKAAVANSPHLEVFKEKGIEVLYLVDSIDEWVVQGLNEFDGKSLKDVTKGDLDIQDEKDKEEQKENEGKFEKLLKSLGAKIEGVKEVRLTSRLKDSPAVLVADEHGMGANMERIMKMTNQSFESQERILELNPKHILSEKLLQAYEADENSDDVLNWSAYLYGQALIAEGSELPNPVEHVQLVNKMLAKI
jgi:molecular chaperone HtpG